jgi:hypothetical protein
VAGFWLSISSQGDGALEEIGDLDLLCFSRMRMREERVKSGSNRGAKFSKTP